MRTILRQWKEDESFDEEVGERITTCFSFVGGGSFLSPSFKLESSLVFRELSGKILVLWENHLWFLCTTWSVGQGVLWICIVLSRKLC